MGESYFIDLHLKRSQYIKSKGRRGTAGRLRDVTLRGWVQALGATEWKRRTGSRKMSSEAHTGAEWREHLDTIAKCDFLKISLKREVRRSHKDWSERAGVAVHTYNPRMADTEVETSGAEGRSQLSNSREASLYSKRFCQTNKRDKHIFFQRRENNILQTN